MLRLLALLTAVTLFALASSAVATCTLTAPRAETFDATGIHSVRIQSGAGALNVIGASGTETIRIDGRACASSRSLLERIRLDVEQEGSTLVIMAVTPDANFLQSASLDLDVRLPARLSVEIEDGSDALAVSGVGELRVRDGSGDVSVSEVESVRIEGDGSGDMVVTDVNGDVTIVEDGSGDMEIRQVGGSVVVIDDGSGDITVDTVGGVLRVEDAGSGSVRYSDVDGEVSVPRN